MPETPEPHPTSAPGPDERPPVPEQAGAPSAHSARGDDGPDDRAGGELGDILAEDGPWPADPVEEAVLRAAGRATLPFQAARADRSYATAFWYNDLVESSGDRELIRQYLVTAEARTRYEIGQFTLRAGLVEPELPADELVLPSFSRKWTPLGDLGVAVMPTVDLHIHAERKGWSWSTEEVTSGLAAVPEDVAMVGTEPLPAYLLGHEVVEEPGSRHAERPQVLLPGTVSREDADPVRWTGPFPAGLAGAPVFTVLPMDDGQVKLVCLGLALPGDPTPVVVTFDLLRPAIHAVTPTRRRGWWRR